MWILIIYSIYVICYDSLDSVKSSIKQPRVLLTLGIWHQMTAHGRGIKLGETPNFNVTQFVWIWHKRTAAGSSLMTEQIVWQEVVILMPMIHKSPINMIKTSWMIPLAVILCFITNYLSMLNSPLFPILTVAMCNK